MLIQIEKVEEAPDLVVYQFLPSNAPGGRVLLRRLPEESIGLERYETSVVLADHRESAPYVVPVLNAIERGVEDGAFPESLVVDVDCGGGEPPSPVAVAMAVPWRYVRVIAVGAHAGGSGDAA